MRCIFLSQCVTSTQIASWHANGFCIYIPYWNHILIFRSFNLNFKRKTGGTVQPLKVSIWQIIRLGISLKWRHINVDVCMYIHIPKLTLMEIYWTKITEQINPQPSEYAGICYLNSFKTVVAVLARMWIV